MKKLLLLSSFCLLASAACAQLYTNDDILQYIADYQDIAMEQMVSHRIPASITLAQGIFESACGKSRLAAVGNNHFGIKCHEEWTGDTILIDDDELQECFRRYASAEESYNDHSLFLTTRPRYGNLFVLDILDYKSWARTLKADGYATNPKYADRLIDLIQRCNLSRLDTLCIQGRQHGDLARQGQEDGIRLAAAGQPAEERHGRTDASRPATGQCKVFTAIGDDWPAGNSPFTFRKVFENNRTYFVIALKNDTYEKIAADVQVTSRNLRKFNDAAKKSQPVENEIVYIEAKRKHNPAKVHVAGPSETLRYISQRYGVQLCCLLKYNNLNEKSAIAPGDKILLKH